MNKVGDVITHKKLGRRKWVVVATCMTGGGVAMFNDRYPDGHQITLMALKKNGRSVDFHTPQRLYFQSGCFTDEAMLMKPVLHYNLRHRPCK